MSVIGINPKRDKMAKTIIYGGGSAYFHLLKILTFANFRNSMAIKLWYQQSKERSEIKEEAWRNYCETGDILGSLKPFVWKG